MQDEIYSLVRDISEKKNSHFYVEKLLELCTKTLSREELAYFHVLLTANEDEVWDLERLYPASTDEDLQLCIIELHDSFSNNLWDDEDILRAMQLSYLLTQAPNEESAEQIIDVWVSTYWDSYFSDQDKTNLEHIASILSEEM